jgi:uncharacterized membrane protein
METIAKDLTLFISRTSEMLAAVIIGFALLKVMFHFVTRLHPSKMKISKEEIRVKFGSSVAVSLELLLGADVLATAIAPSWDDIGKLAAIAVLRTALNYFLDKEIHQTQQVFIGRKEPASRMNGSDHPAGISGRDNTRGNILNDHTARPDRSIGPNRQSRANNTASTYPDIIADGYRSR